MFEPGQIYKLGYSITPMTFFGDENSRKFLKEESIVLFNNSFYFNSIEWFKFFCFNKSIIFFISANQFSATHALSLVIRKL